jgi:hypothetical protein
MITKQQLEQIASENPDGFTIDTYGVMVQPSTLHKWVVARKETLNCTTDNFEQVALIAETSGYIGGWRDENGKVHIDAVDVYTERYKQSFIEDIGRERSQIAIYDLHNSTSIYL